MVAAFRRGLLKLYVMPLISNMTASMTWSIAVIYALDLGADIFQVNLITTIWSTMSIVILLPFGILSDRMGRRPMLLYPRVMMLLGTLIRAVATEPNHLLLAALVGGFAGGGFFPVLLSMIGDIAKPEEQKKAISTLYLFSGISMLIGPLICSFLLTLPQVTLRNIYQIDTFAQAITLVYIMTQIKETLPQTRESKSERVQIKYRDYISHLIRQSSFRGLLTMSFFFFFYNSIMTTYLPIYARVDLNLSDAEIASFSTYRSLAITFIRFLATTFLARVSIRPFLISALTLGGITGLATVFANNYLSTVLIMFFSGASFGATMILGATIANMSSEPRNRGVANSLYNSAQSIGNITKILTSPIADNLGIISVLFLGGITALIATVPALLCKVERVRK
jgi:MFS family permease